MKVLTEGHKYELKSFEGGVPQTLQFIEKVQEVSGALVTVNDGTTNEEVLSVLINRLRNLNAKFPCRENSIVITKLEESLMWLERRTQLRKAQGVEGKQLNHKES